MFHCKACQAASLFILLPGPGVCEIIAKYTQRSAQLSLSLSVCGSCQDMGTLWILPYRNIVWFMKTIPKINLSAQVGSSGGWAPFQGLGLILTYILVLSQMQCFMKWYNSLIRRIQDILNCSVNSLDSTVTLGMSGSWAFDSALKRFHQLTKINRGKGHDVVLLDV